MLVTVRCPDSRTYTCLNCRTVLDPSYSIYNVKHVTAIPLVEGPALKAISTINSRFTGKGHMKARTLPRPRSSQQVNFDDTNINANRKGVARERHHKSQSVYLVKDDNPSLSSNSLKASAPSHSPTSSGTSTPTSDSEPNTPFAKTLIQRLSIWDHLPKGLVTTEEKDGQVRQGFLKDDEPAENTAAETSATSVVASASTTADRESALDTRIVREIIREFTKGGMYFSYNFGEFPSNHV